MSLSKIMLGAAAALTMAGAVVPTAAQAQWYGGRGGYDRGYDGYGRGGYYNRGGGYYGGRDYYDGRRGWRGDRGYRGRCRDKGTGGTILGAIAGGLLGNAAVGRRGDQTMGTIAGAGVGALAGRAIDRDC